MVGRITQTPHQLPKDGGRETGDGGRGTGGRPQLKENIKGKPRKRGAAHP